jgi:hypothetical protein
MTGSSVTIRRSSTSPKTLELFKVKRVDVFLDSGYNYPSKHRLIDLPFEKNGDSNLTHPLPTYSSNDLQGAPDAQAHQIFEILYLCESFDNQLIPKTNLSCICFPSFSKSSSSL